MLERDVRPRDLHNEYLRLTALDAIKFFSNVSERVKGPCQGCGSENVTHSFDKLGFGYDQCSDCHSLYQNPRPPLAKFASFYEKSASSVYWAQTFFPTVLEARREKIFAPRAKQALDFVLKHHEPPKTVIDVGAGHGIFLEEFKKVSPFARLLAIEPGIELAQSCRLKGIEVLQNLAEDSQAWHGKGDLVTCFEVIEHVHDAFKFVSALKELLRPEGCALISGLCADGFDIQCLWDQSKAVSPPHHLNFLSVKGFEALFRRAGFSDVKVLTPGVLDLDIVRSFKAENPDTILPRFVETILNSSADVQKNFQDFLTQNQLSSHAWIFAKK